MSYLVEQLPNGLTRVFQHGSGLADLYRLDGAYHSGDLAAPTIAELLGVAPSEPAPDAPPSSVSAPPSAPQRPPLRTAARWWRRIRAVLIALLLIRSVVAAGLAAIPAPIGRPAPVFRAALPGVDVGADAWPSRMGHAAYVEIWAYPHGAGDVATLLQWPISDAAP